MGDLWSPLFILHHMQVPLLSFALLLLAAGPQDRYPIKGIDVSHHQKYIVWDSVKADTIRFAYIKTTEGSDWADSLYRKNLYDARRAGILAGSYHYFSFCKSGALQARNFCTHAHIVSGDLIPAVDVEPLGNCMARPDTARLRAELGVFMDSVMARTGYEPIIYSMAQFYQRYFKGWNRKARFWIRSIDSTPQEPRDWVFWQYGVFPVKGIRGACDRNVFCDDTAGLHTLLVR
jgi:lysozyme